MNLLGHEVFCFEYADEEQARDVWETARDLEMGHCSVWRTTTLSRDKWMIVVADQSGTARQQIDFGAGVEREMEEAEASRFVGRRMRLALEGVARGETEVRDVTRFGRRGAILGSGGVLDPRIGGDE